MSYTKGSNMLTRTKSIGTLAGLLLAALPMVAQAQAGQTRAGWQPYLGCWEPNAPAQAETATGGQAAAQQGILCFVPSGADVEMLTIVDGEITHREGYFADGQPHPVEQDGCRGTESARFSEDGRRLYTASELTCENGTVRSSTGIISMPGPGEWLDVRALQANGGATAWSQWYNYADDSVLEDLGLPRRSEPLPLVLRGSEFFAAARVTIEDVIDASQNVDAKAVSGWLAQVRQEFDGLGAEELVRLDDAGVPAEVIDVIVAVSFPRHFALGDGRALVDDYGSDRRGRRVFMTPMGYYYSPSVFGYGYGSRFGYGYPGYYGSYGYGSSYWGGWGGYYRPVVVDVNRAPSRSSNGRVIAGRGYRGPRSVSTGGYYGGRSSGISSGSGRSSSAGSASSSRGSSGRTAKRRGGK